MTSTAERKWRLQDVPYLLLLESRNESDADGLKPGDAKGLLCKIFSQAMDADLENAADQLAYQRCVATGKAKYDIEYQIYLEHLKALRERYRRISS